MATVKPPMEVGTAKATAVGQFGPTVWNNVFYFAVGTWDPAHLDDAIAMIATQVAAFWSTVFGFGAMPTAWTFTDTKIAFRDAEDSLYRATVVDAHAGTGGAAYQDAQVAYLVNWTTNDPRKGGKPRQYITGVIDSHMADSARLDPSILSGISGNINTWLANNLAASHGTASGLQLVEESFRNGKTWRDTAHGYPIRRGSLNPIVATQRRRVDRLR